MIASENIFLIILGFVWIIGAVMQDLKRREVDNLWNFSLIGFALSYRFFYSVYMNEYSFFLDGIIGLVVFLVLGNLFYYSRVFAGGDAKLLIALGTILPLSYSWINNIYIFSSFIVMFMLWGSIYAFIWALALLSVNFKNFKKEFKKISIKHKNLYIYSIVVFFVWLISIALIGEVRFLILGIVIVLFPILFVFSKAIEESSMIKALDPKKVTEGDWLYKDIKIKGKVIKATWDGVTKKELVLIKKYGKKKILVKQGIPFTPSFLFALIGLIIINVKFGWF